MQIGLHSQGSKKWVLRDLSNQLEDQLAKYDKECKENQVPVLVDSVDPVTKETIQIPVYEKDEKGKLLVKHSPKPLKNDTAGSLLKAIIDNIVEQVEHVKDDEDIGVSFQLTVHRPNPV